MVKKLLTFLLAMVAIASCKEDNKASEHFLFQPMELGKQVNVSCFDIAENGSIWMGLDGEGLAYKESDNTPCQFFNKLSGTIPADAVINIYRDKNNLLWFATFGNGIFCNKDGNFLPPAYEQLRSKEFDYPSAFIEDQDKRFWIATLNNGIAYVNGEGQAQFFNEDNSNLATNYIADLDSFDSTTIYVATGWGLFSLDTKTQDIQPVTDNNGKPFLEKQLIRSLMTYDDQLWIGTKTGVYIFDRDTRSYKHLTTRDGLADNFVKAIACDQQGDVWTTSDHTITRITKNDKNTYTCQPFSQEDGIGEGIFHVRSIACMPDGTMLFGSSKGCITARSAGQPVSLGIVTRYNYLIIALASIIVILAGILLGRKISKTRNKNNKVTKTTPNSEIELSDIEIKSANDHFKEQLISIVEQNISNADFSVEELSSALGMSRGHLYKRMMATTGKSPLEFIRAIRLRHGKQLLEKSGESISQVAWQIGMSPKQFSKFFKEEYGMLPSDYLKASNQQ